MPSLQTAHTFGLPATCLKLSSFSTTEEFLHDWNHSPRNYLLGGGSNTVFLKDYDGQVLVNKMRGIAHQEHKDSHSIRVAGGENWHNFVSLALAEGWYGMENLALIPGSVGASPIQNIGAYGLEVGQFIESVECLEIKTGQNHRFIQHECLFGYRDSLFKQELMGKMLITHVNFSLPKDYRAEASYGELATLNAPTPHSIYEKVIAVRSGKLPDPDKMGNAGSFFKNPVISPNHYSTIKADFETIPGYAVTEGVKVPAAWLIDQCGFKGHRVGGVRCHPTQPLVLTNLGAGTGDEVITLAKEIIASVYDRFAILLEPEVRLLDEEGLITL